MKFGLETYSGDGKITYDADVIHYTLSEEMNINIRPFDYSPEYKGFHSIIKLDVPLPLDTTPLIAVKLPESDTSGWLEVFGVQEAVLIRQGNLYTHFRVRWLTTLGNVTMKFVFRIYCKSTQAGGGLLLNGRHNSVISADSHYPLVARSFSGRTKTLTDRSKAYGIRDGAMWLVNETYDVPDDSFYVCNMQSISLGAGAIGGVTVRGTTSVVRYEGSFRAVFTVYPSSSLGSFLPAGNEVYLTPTYFIRHSTP